eukprot:UN26495
MDIDGHYEETHVEKALKELREQHCEIIEVLGSYPSQDIQTDIELKKSYPSNNNKGFARPKTDPWSYMVRKNMTYKDTYKKKRHK